MKTALQQLDELLRRAQEYRPQIPFIFCRNCGATNVPLSVECHECKEVFPRQVEAS